MTGPGNTKHRDAWDELVAAGQRRLPDASVVRDAMTAVREAVAQERRSDESVSSGRRRPWALRWAIAAAAGGAVVVSVVAWTLLAPSGSDRPEGPLVQVPGNTSTPSSTAGASGTANPSVTSTGNPGETVVQGVGPLAGSETANCAFDYNAETLADRGFAFEGVIIAVGPEGGSGYPLQDRIVTFSVTHWYKGGSGNEVSLDMWGPGVGTGSGYGVAYSIGTRLLVSGEPRWGGAPLDDAVAWPCGFTRYYDEATAAFWAAVFE